MSETRATTTATPSEAGSAVREPRSAAASGITHLGTETSIYVEPDERYVVMFAASYPTIEEDPDIGVADAQEAAFWALDLVRNTGWEDTHWYVLDRRTGEVHEFEQSDFAGGDD